MSDQEKKQENGPEEKPAPVGEHGQVTLSSEEYTELQRKVTEFEGLREKMLRTAADFENAKKRLLRERDEFARFSQEKILRHLLPVMDNFERALLHSEDVQDEAAKKVITGIQMVFKQFGEILKNEGLTRLETKGKIFDPHQHEAIGYVHEEGKEDEIIEEIEPGYLLHGKLLRAAKVRVRMSPAGNQNKKAGA